MDCPRCTLPLREDLYEGVRAHVCDTCYGFWLDRGDFENILERHTFHFTDDERKLLLDARRHVHKGPTDPAPCPRCSAIMEQLQYDSSVHLIIDHCPEHGIWLDTGEIKTAQAIAEQSEKIHTMLLTKLGLLAKPRGR